jgi:hypothetical protein
MIKIMHNLALFLVKNAFFAEKILKIITSIPGVDSTNLHYGVCPRIAPYIYEPNCWI